MDEWMDKEMTEHMDVHCTCMWIDRQMDGWINVWMNGCKNRTKQIYEIFKLMT